ncbi:hypothetical protein SAMN02745216_03879 [Desulfatibacillum alkenivorans DSM 16219]|jgi:hypothetical protein|uniref:Uncharacterized protein n=1 Tax=Desulfatibacillum alkenivorans DSM 16219 TaxID=1121393 RepID=A0A1M6UE87_9BACT|nr:hypothetical protein [Desulfatibacillum alkenivorans]SHK67487.1 hypothetical protein SAMN02745216_03879 [Desulfatibacillum alkenivorans DSM 16219]
MSSIDASLLSQAYLNFEYEVMYGMLFLGFDHYWIHIQGDGKTIIKKEVTRKRIDKRITMRALYCIRPKDAPGTLWDWIEGYFDYEAFEQFAPLGFKTINFGIYDKKHNYFGTVMRKSAP